FTKKARFLKVHAQALVFTIFSACTVFIGMMFIGFFFIYFIISYPFDYPGYEAFHTQYSQHPRPLFIIFLLVVPVIAFLFVLLTAFPIGIVVSSAKNLRMFRKEATIQDMLILAAIGIVLGVVSFIFFSSFIGFSLSILSGFVIGSLTIRYTLSSKKLLLRTLLFILVLAATFFLLKLTFGTLIDQIYLHNIALMSQIEAVFIIGLVVGQIANVPLNLKAGEEVSWKRVLWWFVISVLIAYAFTEYFRILSFLSFHTAYFIAIALGIAGGQGGKLFKLHEKKPRVKNKGATEDKNATEISNLQYVIMWSQIPRGVFLLLAYCIYFSILGFALTPLIPDYIGPAPFLLVGVNLSIVLSTIYLTLIIGATLGLLVGSIRGIGPFFQYRAEQVLTGKWLSRIGLASGIISLGLGFILAILN
ncbi:MAG TPA: hypothetical protein VEP90_10665, partial [Methylomirabilota bacterium]|nr:hypothetical protein [Methylomirabilota bacterium]